MCIRSSERGCFSVLLFYMLRQILPRKIYSKENPTNSVWTGAFRLRKMSSADAVSPLPPELYKACHIRMLRVPPWNQLLLFYYLYRHKKTENNRRIKEFSDGLAVHLFS